MMQREYEYITDERKHAHRAYSGKKYGFIRYEKKKEYRNVVKFLIPKVAHVYPFLLKYPFMGKL